MSRRSAVGLVAALALAGCGGGAKSNGGYATGAPVKGKAGGTLTVLSRGDVDSIDPGATYYPFTFMLAYATQRPLYSYGPGDGAHAVPDLAIQLPHVSPDRKTITVRLRDGVRFSPPVDRAATSQDVKYAIERGFDPRVGNGYARKYFSSLVGGDRAAGRPIAGIETPDPHTIVFRLTSPRPALVVGALSLPLSAPVPPEYARRLDASRPSAYGSHQVATGPYMIRSYTAGRHIELARNPNWDPRTDYRPAYLDRILVDEGNADLVGASRRILRGRGLVNGQVDFDVPPAIVRQVVAGSAAQRRQFVAGDSNGRVRYVWLDTTIAPFDKLDVRRAIAAGIDREALRRPFGGALAGKVPTHFLPPAVPGFQQAGGAQGPALDFLARPRGDPALAASYLRRAGYPSGRYPGRGSFAMVADDTGPGRAVAVAVRGQLERLGFRIVPRFVAHAAMSTTCVPGRRIAICPTADWTRDFPDPEVMLAPFQGVRVIDVDPAKRIRAWAGVDRRVTAQALVVPWLWDRATGIESRDVDGVMSRFNGTWDLSFTSLK